ncbi:MAG: hypothetical protein ACFFGZ_14085 [Candidatus Thorarchaeota archaeon]
MPYDLEEIAEVLVFINGTVLLLIGLIFVRLYFRYRKRNYLLLILVIFSAALQMIFSEIDVLILPAAIIGSIMNILILIMILFPEKVPFNFDEPQFPAQLPESPEDD